MYQQSLIKNDTYTSPSMNDYILRERSASSPTASRFAATSPSPPHLPASPSNERSTPPSRQPVPRFPWADLQDSRSPKASVEAHPYALGRSPVLSALIMSPPPSSSSHLVEYGVAVGEVESPQSTSPMQVDASSAHRRAVSKEAIYSQSGAYETNWRRRQRENSDSVEGGGGSVSSHLSAYGGHSTVPTSVESHSIEDFRGLAASPLAFRSPSSVSKTSAATTLVPGRLQQLEEVLRSVPISPAFEASTFTIPPRPSLPDLNSFFGEADNLMQPGVAYAVLRPQDRSGWDSDDEKSIRAPTKKELKRQEKLEKEALKQWKKVRKEVANRPRVDFGDVSLPPAEALLHDVPRFSLRTVTKEVQAAGEKALIEPIAEISEVEPEQSTWGTQLEDADVAREAHHLLQASSASSKVKALFRFGAKRNVAPLTATPPPPSQSSSTSKRAPRRLHKTKPSPLVISSPDMKSGPTLPPLRAPLPLMLPATIRRGVGNDPTKIRPANEFESDFGYLGRKTELFDAVDAAEVARKAHRRTSSLPSSFRPISRPPVSPAVPVDVEALAPPPGTSTHPIIAGLPVDRRLRSRRADRRNEGDIRAAMVTGWLEDVAFAPEAAEEQALTVVAESGWEREDSGDFDSTDSNMALEPPRPFDDPTRPSPSSSQVPHSPDHAVVHHRRRYGGLHDTLDLPATPPLASPGPYGGLDTTEEQATGPAPSKSTQLLDQLLRHQESIPTHDSYLSLSEFPDPPRQPATKQRSIESMVDAYSNAGSHSSDALLFNLATPSHQHPFSKSYSSGFTLSSAKDDELFFHPPGQPGESYPRRAATGGTLAPRDQSTRRTSDRSSHTAQRLDLVRRTPSLVKTSSLSRGASGRRHPPSEATPPLSEYPKSSVSSDSMTAGIMGGSGAATGLRNRLQKEVAKRT